MATLDILMAQLNTRVGDFEGNADRVLAVARRAVAEKREPVIVFPELTLSGYPPEDLLLRPSLEGRVQRALGRLRRELPAEAVVVLGYPRRVDGRLYNMAGVLRGGELVAEYAKRCLPNYQVFDEKRYFAHGNSPGVLEIAGVPVALSVCEDIWEEAPILDSAAAGARLLLNLNASPFHRGKQRERLEVVGARARTAGIPVVYVNQVGGQDELVFDGGSFAVAATGEVMASAPGFREAETWVRVNVDDDGHASLDGTTAEPLDDLPATWEALVLGALAVLAV